MSPRHQNVFNYLIAFLQELPRHESENKLNPHLIGEMLCLFIFELDHVVLAQCAE